MVGVNGKVTVRATKTEQSERRIELDPVTALDVLTQMERVRARAEAAEVELVEDPYLFSSLVSRAPPVAGVSRMWKLRLDGSEPWPPSYPTKAWRGIRESVGLPHVQLRTLRHFTATELLGAGVDIKTVQRRLGHARASMTLDVYGNFLPGTDGAAATHMGDLLRRDKQGEA